MNAPVVVWQRGGYRIVAVDEDEHEDANTGDIFPGPFLIIECAGEDAMGANAWLPIFADNDEAQDALVVLKTEVAARNEVVPTWVRDFLRKELAALDREGKRKSEHGGAA